MCNDIAHVDLCLILSTGRHNSASAQVDVHLLRLNVGIVIMQVYGKKTPLFINIINGVLCVTLFFVTIVSSVSSIRYIVVDSVNYHVFANL